MTFFLPFTKFHVSVYGKVILKDLVFQVDLCKTLNHELANDIYIHAYLRSFIIDNLDSRHTFLNCGEINLWNSNAVGLLGNARLLSFKHFI